MSHGFFSIKVGGVICSEWKYFRKLKVLYSGYGGGYLRTGKRCMKRFGTSIKMYML